MPDAAIFNGTKRHPGTQHGEGKTGARPRDDIRLRRIGYTASRPHDRRSQFAAKPRLRFVPMPIFAENTKENRAFFARL